MVSMRFLPRLAVAGGEAGAVGRAGAGCWPRTRGGSGGSARVTGLRWMSSRMRASGSSTSGPLCLFRIAMSGSWAIFGYRSSTSRY
ncbi:hypothetical protein D3C85_1332680 [compost metagenome]